MNTTITLGNVLTALVIVGGMMGLWSKLNSRLTAIETRIGGHQERWHELANSIRELEKREDRIGSLAGKLDFLSLEVSRLQRRLDKYLDKEKADNS